MNQPLNPELFCRICGEAGDLIRVCDCGGVHPVCLDWARTAQISNAFTHCPACYRAYKLALVVETESPHKGLRRARYMFVRSFVLSFLTLQAVILLLGGVVSFASFEADVNFPAYLSTWIAWIDKTNPWQSNGPEYHQKTAYYIGGCILGFFLLGQQ